MRVRDNDMKGWAERRPSERQPWTKMHHGFDEEGNNCWWGWGRALGLEILGRPVVSGSFRKMTIFFPDLLCLLHWLWLEETLQLNKLYFLIYCQDPGFSSWAAVTELHRLGSLNNRHLLLRVLETRKFKTAVPESWNLVRALFLVCSLPTVWGYVLTWWRERSSVLFLLIRALIPFTQAPASWPNYLLEALPPNPTHWWFRLQHMDFGGKQTLSLQNLALGKKLPMSLKVWWKIIWTVVSPFFYTQVQGQGHEPKIFSYQSDSANKKGFDF